MLTAEQIEMQLEFANARLARLLRQSDASYAAGKRIVAAQFIGEAKKMRYLIDELEEELLAAC
jgi:hypothetical protein